MSILAPVYPESESIRVREANESDVEAIGSIYRATYGEHYAYPEFYDPLALKRLVFSPDAVMLVAESKATGRVLGCASVLFEMGAHSDLVGEFGRLAVHPDGRRQGIGELLMLGRLAGVQDRLHLAIGEARVVHPFSQRIAARHEFVTIGFLPLKLLFDRRESAVLLVRYFGEALRLRQSAPRIIPEVEPIATGAMAALGLSFDGKIDESSPAYPPNDAFDVTELTSAEYPALLCIQRGRLRQREIFGPMRLHYGYYRIRASHSSYLIARRTGDVVGAIGFARDNVEKNVRVFELSALNDQVVRFLLTELDRRCRHEWNIAYVEIDASAYSPRLQRTLLELDFMPVAYVPAMVFHDVARLDVVKMARLYVPLELGAVNVLPQAESIVETVVRGFRARSCHASAS